MSGFTPGAAGAEAVRRLDGTTSLVVHLPAEQLVLKIRSGPSAAAAAQRDVALARLLARHTSFASPLDGAAAVRTLADGAAATVWRFLDAGEPDHAGLGTALRRLHEIDPYEAAADGQRLTRLDDLSDVGAGLERLRDAGEVTRGRLDVLSRTIERLQAELDEIRGEPVVVHGDLHPPNIIWTTSGAVLCDTDEIGLADPRWDIAFLLDPGRPHRLSGAPAHDFLDAYGGAAPSLPVARTFARAAHLRRTVRVLRSVGLRNRVWTLVRVGSLQRMLARPDLDLVPAVGQSRAQQVRSGLVALSWDRARPSPSNGRR